MRRKSKIVRLEVRLYPGDDDDLIEWAGQLDREGYGLKAQRLRETLRRGIAGKVEVDAPAPALDLGEIRRVVEAAVASALARFEGQFAVSAPQEEEDEEVDDLLETMGQMLKLPEVDG